MKIYVGHLSPDVTDADLNALFATYGQVESAEVVKDRFTGSVRVLRSFTVRATGLTVEPGGENMARCGRVYCSDVLLLRSMGGSSSFVGALKMYTDPPPACGGSGPPNTDSPVGRTLLSPGSGCAR